jgi:hypothetical protein
MGNGRQLPQLAGLPKEWMLFWAKSPNFYFAVDSQNLSAKFLPR